MQPETQPQRQPLLKPSGRGEQPNSRERRMWRSLVGCFYPIFTRCSYIQQRFNPRAGCPQYTCIITHLKLSRTKARLNTNLFAKREFLFFSFVSVYSSYSIRSHPSMSILRARYEDSTTNLMRHVKNCDPLKPSKQIVAYANGTTYSPARFRYLIAMWCARRHQPFIIVEDPELVEIFQMLYCRVNIPSHVMVSRDIQEIFEHCWVNVSLSLQVCLICRTQHILTFF